MDNLIRKGDCHGPACDYTSLEGLFDNLLSSYSCQKKMFEMYLKEKKNGGVGGRRKEERKGGREGEGGKEEWRDERKEGGREEDY